MNTITVSCQHCGNPLVLELPLEAVGLTGAYKEIVEKLARITVHNACGDAILAKQKGIEEDTRLAKCMEKWELLCPPFFQTTEAFLAGLKDGDRPVINRRALAKVGSWAFGPKGLIIFGSTSGSGKTSSAYLLVKRSVLAGKTASVYSHVKFTEIASQLVQQNQKAASRWMTLVCTCDVLVIDDFGKSRFKTNEGLGKLAEEVLYDIIDARILNLRPTIITSNDNYDTLRGKFSADKGEPFLRRLRESFNAINFDKYE